MTYLQDCNKMKMVDMFKQDGGHAQTCTVTSAADAEASSIE